MNGMPGVRNAGGLGKLLEWPGYGRSDLSVVQLLSCVCLAPYGVWLPAPHGLVGLWLLIYPASAV